MTSAPGSASRKARTAELSSTASLKGGHGSPLGDQVIHGAGAAGRFKPARPRNVESPPATLSGDSSISGDSRGAPRGSVLPLISGR